MASRSAWVSKGPNVFFHSGRYGRAPSILSHALASTSENVLTNVPGLLQTAGFALQLYWKLKQKTPGTGPWLREQLIDLGPLHVKLGQFASSRKGPHARRTSVTSSPCYRTI